MSHPQHRRQRPKEKIARTLLTAIVAIAVVGFAVIGLWHHSETSTGPSVTSTTLARTTTTTAPSEPMWPEETQLAARVTSLLKRRIGTSEIAIEDMHSRQILSLGGQSPQYEASVVKVNILTALLAEKHDSTAPLSLSQQKLAQEMIEVSDNDAATALWNAVGGTGGIAAFNRKIGLTKTTPSKCVQCPGFPWPGWGLTTTTPDDEIKLLKEVFFANETLSAADQGYERQLMQSITPSEKWGVTNGVASGATVALKNGWLPLNSSDTDWQINSVGWVRGDGRDYVIALFSTGNPSEQYGISTLNAISSMAWQYARN